MNLKKLRSESGVALMMVLASLLIISTVVVEFAYNAHIAYEVAATQRDRLKATYLAYSALNLVQMELKSEKQLRQQFASMLSQLSDSGVSSDPFCKLFPLSSGLIQGLASGQLAMPGGEEAENAEPTEEKEAEAGDLVAEEDPFNLGGDFEGSCDTEERKINLNAFRQTLVGEGGASNPLANTIYEQQKSLLTSLLSQEQFERFFDGRSEAIRKLVNAIADWADTDDRINESPGIAGSYEEGEYSDLPYKPKNGKYATKAELLLIPGMGDDLYRLLEPNLTVYGDNRINLCQATDEMVLAFLTHYGASTPGATPFNPSDEPRKVALLASIRDACSQPNPQPAQIANVITSSLGGSAGGGEEEESGDRRRSSRSRRSTVRGGGGLASRISTTNRFYSIAAVGRSGEAQVTLRTVVDAEPGISNSWKTLYFRVE